MGRTPLSNAVDVDLGFCGERPGRMQYRGRALQRREKGKRVEQAVQAWAKEAPRIVGFSRRGTSTQRGESRSFDKLRTGPQLSTGPGSSLRHKVPKGRMKIARQFTGGNAQHQTPTASRRDAVFKSSSSLLPCYSHLGVRSSQLNSDNKFHKCNSL